LHHTTPGNLEAYTQEAGRAGRDGQLADVVLYFSPEHTGDDKKKQNDNDVQRFFLDNKYIREEDVRSMLNSFNKSTKSLMNGILQAHVILLRTKLSVFLSHIILIGPHFLLINQINRKTTNSYLIAEIYTK